MTDTAEYWNDIKRGGYKHIPTHIEGVECGIYHINTTNNLYHVDCHACKRHIESNPNLIVKREQDKLDWENKLEFSRRKKKGYRILQHLKFGKYKGSNRNLKWIIENDYQYFLWMQGKVLFHPECDKFLK